MATCTVEIDSVAVELRKGSLLVELRIEERSIAEFTVVDRLGMATYVKGQPIEIYDTVPDLVFGGVIETPEVTAISPTGGLHHHIRCVDWHYKADKRLAAESYEDKTCGFIVDDLFDKYLAPEGITIGNIELGATLIEAVFNYVRVSDCYDALAEKAGFVWFIDEHKALYFQARDTTAAPWAANAATNIDNCRLSGGNPKYRNRQYIRGGKDQTALQTENFIGDAKQNAFTVSFPLAKVPVSIKIDAGAALTMGIKGLDAPGDFDTYWAKGDPVITFTAVPGAAAAIEIKYYGMFDILVLVVDEDAIDDRLAVEGAGTGFVDNIDDEPKLTEKEAAIDAGRAKIAKFAVAGRRLLYTTHETGLKPGQLQPITYSAFGLAATEMLIEAVTIRGFGTETIHEITAIVGPTMGSWSAYFKALASMKQEIIERLNVGSEQILIILVERAETWNWAESIAYTITTCHFPAADLYPEATLYPC